MSIGPYHLGRYSSIGSRPYVRGAIQESDDLVSHHQRVGGTVRGLTIQDARTMEHLRNVPIYSGGFEVASDGNGNEIDTLFNVNGKNPEDDNQTPQTGMSFSSELEAEEYYKKYAKRKGFTVRKGKVRKRNGTTTWRCFLCSCEGIRAKKHSNQGTKYQRSETRTGCNAQIQVKLDNGQWVITKLHLEHNHRLQCLDTLNWPSDEPNGPSDEPNGLSDELNWPSDEWNGLSDELNGPSDELEGASGADKVCQNRQLKLTKCYSLGTFTSKSFLLVNSKHKFYIFPSLKFFGFRRSKLPSLQLKLKTEMKLSQILTQLQGFLRWLRDLN